MQRFSSSIESFKTVDTVLRPFNKQSHQIVCTIIFLRHFNFASQFSPLFLSVALFPSLEYYIHGISIWLYICPHNSPSTHSFITIKRNNQNVFVCWRTVPLTNQHYYSLTRINHLNEPQYSRIVHSVPLWLVTHGLLEEITNPPLSESL